MIGNAPPRQLELPMNINWLLTSSFLLISFILKTEKSLPSLLGDKAIMMVRIYKLRSRALNYFTSTWLPHVFQKVTHGSAWSGECVSDLIPWGVLNFLSPPVFWIPDLVIDLIVLHNNKCALESLFHLQDLSSF